MIKMSGTNSINSDGGRRHVGHGGGRPESAGFVPVFVPVTGTNAKRPSQVLACEATCEGRLKAKRRGQDSNLR